MKKFFCFSSLVFLVVTFCPQVSGPSKSAAQGIAIPSKYFDLKDLQPGMKGIGHTVFNGTLVSDFNVEILGVIENFLPKQSAIFAKLSGGPLGETGVFAGMSGSPVFVDGKILGAVAYAFPFSKEAIAAITPIANVVAISDGEENLNGKVSRGAVSPPLSGLDSTESIEQQQWALVPKVNLIPARMGSAGLEKISGLPNPGALKQIDTPLMLSGFPASAIEAFGPQLRAMGLVPVMGGAIGGPDVPDDTIADAADVMPGSGVGAQLVRGIFGATAAGKVTYRDGSRIYAFGHPFLQSGPTNLPMTKTKIITVLPSLMSSTEVSVPTELIGTIKQDRVSGILGEVGTVPRMIPVTVRLRSSRNASKTFQFETVSDRFLTPFLVNFTVFSALTSSERTLGESTLDLQGTIEVKGSPAVRIQNFVSGDANASVLASLSVANPVNFLLQSGLRGVQINSIVVDVTSWDEKRQATLERIWSDRREVRAGDPVEISALLRKNDGEETLVRIPITIPDHVPPGPLNVSVYDGGSLSQIETRETRPTFQAKDLTQLIRTMNQLRHNNRLYVRLTRAEQAFALYGEAYPSVPPSLAATLATDRASGGNLTSLRSSTIATIDGPQLSSLLSGQRTLTLTVTK